MKHVATLTKVGTRPALAANGLYVKQAWLAVFMDIVDLAGSWVNLVDDILDRD